MAMLFSRRFLLVLLVVVAIVGVVAAVFAVVTHAEQGRYGFRAFVSDCQRYAVMAWRFLLALSLSAAIGIERERHDKPAGVRTVAMVGTGSCLFGLLAVTVFGGGDSASRIVQGVITGIGFLGAGTIIKEQFRVEGLTTAATIWAAAGVGLAAGLGAYALAVMGTAAVFFILFVLRLIEKRLRSASDKPPEAPADPAD